MSKKAKTNTKKSPVPGFVSVQSAAGVHEYVLKNNGLRVLFHARKGTGVITTNITYLVGAADESVGKSGIAHMLEHMLFKPTTFDVANKITAGGAMQFERETGCLLNANTWKDRTTYYFSYPAEYVERALEIEAQRMTGVILNDKELTPEQGNVLSEFDMYNGDPYFALSVQIVSAAFHSHPYGHETIGYREDIEDYTPARLEQFYRDYYRPDNAVMMVIGDIDIKSALQKVKMAFGAIKKPETVIPRHNIREPKQEGVRRVTINRPSSTNIVSLGFKHAGFGSLDWITTMILIKALTGGPESILQKKLVDTGLVASIDTGQEPTKDENVAILHFTLAPNQQHQAIEEKIFTILSGLTEKDVAQLIKKAKANLLTDELFARSNSLQIAQELTEYVASGDWTTYAKTPELLQTVTPKMVIKMLSESFALENMTIGYFIGT